MNLKILPVYESINYTLITVVVLLDDWSTSSLPHDNSKGLDNSAKEDELHGHILLSIYRLNHL